MATKTVTHVAAPDPNDIGCGNCEDMFPARGNQKRTFEIARVIGWHIHEGTLNSGKDVLLVLCPNCVDRGVPMRQARKVLDGQLEMFPATAYRLIAKEGDRT